MSSIDLDNIRKYEDRWLDPDQKRSKTYNYVVGTCCHCKDDIFDTDEHKTISDGMIHTECMEEYMDKIWSEFADFEKYNLLNEKGII